MTPFPETEIMTIKRLEVALRKMDYKLLKDGAYKLHEKFHGGHHFEYTDLLKEILDNVSSNPSIPEDTKSILIPTINDILKLDNSAQDIAQDNFEQDNFDKEDNFPQERVSALTSLSYTIPKEPEKEELREENNNTQEENLEQDRYKKPQEAKISAFSAFGTQSSHNNQANQAQTYKPHTFTQSPFSAQPFKEFTNPSIVTTQPVEVQNIAPSVQNPIQETKETIEEEKLEKNQETQKEVTEEISKELKSVAIFFNQNSSYEKNKNIAALREEISKINDRDISLTKILNLICEINIQTNTDISALQSTLEQIKDKNNRINLITNAQSANLVELFKKTELDYSFVIPREDKNINLIPYLGLSNLFKCSECGEEYLYREDNIAPLALQCPKCKKAMFANLYTAKGVDSEINLNYYNSAMLSLVNSSVWVLITPSQDDKFSINILRTALRMSNAVKEIYILDKDINTKEQYRNMFHEINENIKVDIQPTALGGFLDSIR